MNAQRKVRYAAGGSSSATNIGLLAPGIRSSWIPPVPTTAGRQPLSSWNPCAPSLMRPSNRRESAP